MLNAHCIKEHGRTTPSNSLSIHHPPFHFESCYAVQTHLMNDQRGQSKGGKEVFGLGHGVLWGVGRMRGVGNIFTGSDSYFFKPDALRDLHEVIYQQSLNLLTCTPEPVLCARHTIDHVRCTTTVLCLIFSTAIALVVQNGQWAEHIRKSLLFKRAKGFLSALFCGHYGCNSSAYRHDGHLFIDFLGVVLILSPANFITCGACAEQLCVKYVQKGCCQSP